MFFSYLSGLTLSCPWVRNKQIIIKLSLNGAVIVMMTVIAILEKQFVEGKN